MAQKTASWQVRFPDGRVVQAHSTEAVRYHIERGRIPANSRVRRSAEEKWQSLDAAPDFADLLAPPADPPSQDQRNSSRSSPGRSNGDFRVFGVAALVNELFNAVDLSLHRQKLWISVAATLVWSVGLVGLSLAFELAQGWMGYGLAALMGVILLFVGALAGSALAQMTVIEMLHRRRAQWREIKPRLLRNAWNIMLSQGIFLAALWLPIEGLRRVPDWFQDGNPHDVLLGFVVTLRLVVEIFVVFVAGLGLLLVPIAAVEECSFLQALANWWDLLRSDLSRTFLYETLAVALGVLLTLPLFFPVLYVGWDLGFFANKHLSAVSQATLYVLGGLALTPLVAYLVVANVFIYLNMRYEFFSPSS